MKNILIIALPRSGGTALMDMLAEEHTLKSRFEPELQSSSIEPKNDVTKIIVDRFNLGDIYNLCLYYDKIILHSRRDSVACAESLAYMHWYSGKDGQALTPWSDGMLESIPKWYIEQTKHRINTCKNLIIDISNKLNIPIQYYEDVFNTDSPDRLRKSIKASVI